MLAREHSETLQATNDIYTRGDRRRWDAQRHMWLDNPTASFRAWVTRQADWTRLLLDAVAAPLREGLHTRYKQLSDFSGPAPLSTLSSGAAALEDLYAAPARRDKNYYFLRQDGESNQPIFYRQEGLMGKPQAILNPNELNPEGTTARHLAT